MSLEFRVWSSEYEVSSFESSAKGGSASGGKVSSLSIQMSSFALPSYVSRLTSTILRLPSHVYRLPSYVYHLTSYVYRLTFWDYPGFMPYPSTLPRLVTTRSVVIRSGSLRVGAIVVHVTPYVDSTTAPSRRPHLSRPLFASICRRRRYLHWLAEDSEHRSGFGWASAPNRRRR
jgi:hypothetical protein